MPRNPEKNNYHKARAPDLKIYNELIVKQTHPKMKIMDNHNVASLILLAVVLVATPQLHGAEPDGPKIDRRVFLDTDGKAIRDAQTEIEAAKLEWENRLRKLAIHLEAEGWEPRQDSDYQGWTARLEQLREDQAILKRKASEAFIAFVKFRLSPDAKSDGIYRNKLKDALSGADALGAQYRQLQDFKTPRGYSDKVTVKKSLTTHVNTGVNPSVTQENLKEPYILPTTKKLKSDGENKNVDQQKSTTKPGVVGSKKANRNEFPTRRLSGRIITANPKWSPQKGDGGRGRGTVRPGIQLGDDDDF